MATSREGKGKGLFIISIIILVVFVLIFVFFGVRGFLNVIKWFFIIAFILSIIGGIIYLIWYFFFRKQKFDVTYVNKMKMMDACKKGDTGVLKGLYVSGDKGHSRVFWGRITGYCRISVLTKTIKVDDDGKEVLFKNKESGRQEIQYDIGSEEQDVFSISHASTFIGKMFEEEDVVRVSPFQHDELVGDVTIYGFSLIPISEYWFINDDFLDVRKIDYAILKEAQRGIMFEMLRDSKTIVDKASGLDSGHQKNIEEKSLYEMPVHANK